MQEDNNLTDHIDAYLDGTLSDSDKQAFLQRMQEDAAFLLEVEAQRAVRSLVLRLEKRAYFQQLEEELFNTTALIDRYLEGSMTQVELEWFEQKLSEEPELQQDVEAHRMIIEAVKRQELKKKFLDLEKEIEAEQKDLNQNETPVIPLNNTRGMWMAIAASVAILISVAAIFFLNQPQQDQLYASYSIELDENALGFAGDKLSIEVIIMKSEKYPRHYTLKEEGLTIYLEDPSLNKGDFQIEYDPSADQPYLLTIKENRYLLEYTSDQPQTLEAIQ